MWLTRSATQRSIEKDLCLGNLQIHCENTRYSPKNFGTGFRLGCGWRLSHGAAQDSTASCKHAITESKDWPTLIASTGCAVARSCPISNWTTCRPCDERS